MAKTVYLSPSMQENNRGVGNFGTEEYRMNQVADVVQRILLAAGVTVYRNKPDWTLEQMVNDSNNKKPNIHFAIHSNAGGGRGCEVFCYSTGSESERLAKAVYTEVEPLTPTSDRGIKIGSHLYEIRKTVATAALIEIAFHDNADDAAFIINNIEAIGTAIARGILKYFGMSMPATQPKTPTKEDGILIMGKTEATAAQMVSFALKGNQKPSLPNCTLEELAKIFIEEAEAEGVRADIAWAQSIKETGYFKYGGIVQPGQNNFAGIGALNGNAAGQAASFESPRMGVRAQIQHLKAYASKDALVQECVDPRFGLVTRGSAKFVEWLGVADNPNGKGWAYPGDGYGESILKLLDGILKEDKGKAEETPASSVPQWQLDGLNKLVAAGVINSPEYWSTKLEEGITVGEVFGILGKMYK